MASKSALIVVDVQNDFTPPNGSLAVAGTREIIPLINKFLALPSFSFKVATKDFHPPNHISFASNHEPPNNQPFTSYVDVKNVVGGKPEESMKQRLWPDHCVQGTAGADIVSELDIDKVDLIINKGMDHRVEMYSAFADSFGNMTAGAGGVSHDLAQILRDKGIKDVYVVGIAGDYCLKDTALDAAKLGFNTYVIDEAQRSVDPSAWSEVRDHFSNASVKLVSAQDEEIKKLGLVV